MEYYPDIKKEYKTFDIYHKWYTKYEYTKHADNSFPVLVDPSCGEAFIDGMHRFHSYLSSGFSHIPIIDFR